MPSQYALQQHVLEISEPSRTRNWVPYYSSDQRSSERKHTRTDGNVVLFNGVCLGSVQFDSWVYIHCYTVWFPLLLLLSGSCICCEKFTVNHHRNCLPEVFWNLRLITDRHNKLTKYVLEDHTKTYVWHQTIHWITHVKIISNHICVQLVCRWCLVVCNWCVVCFMFMCSWCVVGVMFVCSWCVVGVSLCATDVSFVSCLCAAGVSLMSCLCAVGVLFVSCCVQLVCR